MSDELKPCPFCKTNMREVWLRNESSLWFEHPRRGCMLDGQRFKIAAWNTRQPEWVSVDDRLPEDFMEVLVRTPDYVVEAYYDRRDTDSGWQCWLRKTEVILTYANVTHWMPLPEPPEKV